MKSVAEKSLDMTSLFEAEVFVRLLLANWKHPFADDEEFANLLLEGAASALREACDGVQLIEGLPASNLNFVAAVWYAEQSALEMGGPEIEEIDRRQAWLNAIRKSVPSCFCDPGDLNTP